MDPILCALKNEISALLALTPADNLYWCGSHTDLFEAAALVCTSFPLYTSAGHLYRVGPLIHDLCLRLHLEEPHNPRAYLFKAKHRKYIRQLPFQQRYAQCALRHLRCLLSVCTWQMQTRRWKPHVMRADTKGNPPLKGKGIGDGVALGLTLSLSCCFQLPFKEA